MDLNLSNPVIVGFGLYKYSMLLGASTIPRSKFILKLPLFPAVAPDVTHTASVLVSLKNKKKSKNNRMIISFTKI